MIELTCEIIRDHQNVCSHVGKFFYKGTYLYTLEITEDNAYIVSYEKDNKEQHLTMWRENYDILELYIKEQLDEHTAIENLHYGFPQLVRTQKTYLIDGEYFHRIIE